MGNDQFEVFLVDDDPSVLKALGRLLHTAGYKTHAFSSAKSFLSCHYASVPGCAVLDLTMPGWDGFTLQRKMAIQAPTCPIIFLTGRGSVPDCVRAMQAGAIDFLLKPVQGNALLQAVARAADKCKAARKVQDELQVIGARLDTLSPREREVLTHVIGGRLNKQIAADLGTVEKTIKVHRSRIMAKMSVRSVAELVRRTERIGLQPAVRIDAGSRKTTDQIAITDDVVTQSPRIQQADPVHLLPRIEGFAETYRLSGTNALGLFGRTAGAGQNDD